MRVAIVNLTGGGLSGGYRKYLEAILPRLAGHDRIKTLHVFVPPAMTTILRVPGLRLEGIGRGRRARPRMQSRLRELRPDVIFVPTARRIAAPGVPVVVMVRNMEPLELPHGGNPWQETLRNYARRYEAHRTCSSATRVVAVSQHVRSFLVEQWGVPDNRIDVVYHGVNPVPRSGNGVAPTPARRFLFTAGSIRPARGLEDAVLAMRIVAEAGFEHELVVAGGSTRVMNSYFEHLRALAVHAGVSDRIRWLGEVDSSTLIAAMTRCDLFLMTSRAEACPNVALEAMSAGCASVSVDRPPMPEFFGDAALYYPTGDQTALGRIITNLLSNRSAADDLRSRAVKRAQAFTWDSTVAHTIATLERAAHSRSGAV